MNNCVDQTTLLSTVVASSLFIISELLPYINKVKGNGIVQVLTEILKNNKEVTDIENQLSI